jgi:PTS system nitrogen regulatory IIA component
MDLQSLIDRRLVWCDVAAGSREAVLDACAERLAAELGVRAVDVAQRLREREALGPTALGGGVAIPHCKLDALSRVVLAVVRLVEPGVDWGAPDGKPVRLLLVVLSPSANPAAHLQALAAISRWLRGPEVMAQLLAAVDQPQLLACLPGQGAAQRDPAMAGR